MLPDSRQSDDRAGVSPTSNRATILIVEDNQVNSMILRAMLRKHGWEPLVAADGIEGVEMTMRHRPGLILMDLQMPRLDGFAAAGEIRRRCAGTIPAIVAVTANVEPAVRAACVSAGFSDVLAKPVAMEELVSTVRRHLAP
ncbi:response regulator [Amaricoccus sp.]|uniref:response regulator n=1 Tax=Amaricoccus sp. TaxID=1872485 RepID=UPI00261B4EAD|nr:response regulator [uncultured Amaricoccus sp.]